MQQYAANFGQVIESVVGRPENAKPFSDAGGDELLLAMFQLTVPGPRPLLARATCAWAHGSQVEPSSKYCARKQGYPLRMDCSLLTFGRLLLVQPKRKEQYSSNLHMHAP